MTLTVEQIQAEASRRAMNETGLTTAQRKAFAARVEADLRAEAEQAEKTKLAEQAQAEAQAERARIATVIRAGSSTGRPRQAARLALSTPLDAAGAKALLATLPSDMHAAPEAVAITSEVGTFGTPAAQAERCRIASILGHAEAEGRFPVAAALAVETALDPTQALAALLAAPRQEAKKYPSFEQRQREAGSFGPSFYNGGGMSKGERIDSMWAKAVKEANASIGAIPAPVAATTPPNPSITRDEADALRGAAGLAGGALADIAKD